MGVWLNKTRPVERITRNGWQQLKVGEFHERFLPRAKLEFFAPVVPHHLVPSPDIDPRADE